ncbi:MAG TPA: thiol protease/hemagglutinin PrtT [Bacteroidia bacterium]|jgi:hypothetical protein|nr:thiol protease/hemagglutinin PrtT [Bacteroidia bacterium]
MKKIKVLALSVLLGAGLVKANTVSVTVAQKVAQNFYSAKYAANTSNASLAYTERDANAVPVFYAFNVNNNKGFVIVTAEDAAYPIIGYSDEGAFVVPATNNNVYFWLQSRKNEVIAMRTQNITANADITDEWTSYTNNTKRAIHSIASGRDSVLPLCHTYWDQSPYYNDMCPGGSVTGCVATAMAQIMRYWSYPSVGIGSHCYNDNAPYFSESYGTLCATYDTSHYVWSEMQNNPLGRPNAQIAKLMFDCGVSVDMDYTPTGSGAFVDGGNPSAQYSFPAYFGYDASTINFAPYSSNQQANFIAILENELNNKRPMQFEGADPSEGGHSWVCDGYSATNQMHMNWGWSGNDNGYFAVSSLNPSPFDFSQNIGVVYGIEPPPGALAVATISNKTGISVYPNPSHGVFNFDLTNNGGNYLVKIYNVLGQEVNTTMISTGNSTINLSAQSKGVYIYRVLSDKGASVSTGRLVVE